MVAKRPPRMGMGSPVSGAMENVTKAAPLFDADVAFETLRNLKHAPAADSVVVVPCPLDGTGRSLGSPRQLQGPNLFFVEGL